MAFYLRTENEKIEFLVDGIHDIKETDMLVSDEDYDKFFEMQSQGKQYRIKNHIGSTLFEVLEEYTPEIEELTQSTTLEDRVMSMFKSVLAGDYQSLAYQLYPEDFENYNTLK